jgi:NAD+ kinase
MRFALVSRQDPESIGICAAIRESLAEGGLSYDEKDPQLVCVVGGDGTFLTAIHRYLDRRDEVMFTGLNTGTLGFFADYTGEERQQFVRDVLTLSPQLEEKRLLAIAVKGSQDASYLAVNEARVENLVATQTIDVFINDKKLETYRGTGLCVSTQVGSTAYNRSLRGAVIERGLDVLELTEVTGIHHAHYRSLGVPMILDGANRIRMVSGYDETSLLCFDRSAYNLSGAAEVACTLSDQRIRLAHYRPTEYIEHLYHLF